MRTTLLIPLFLLSPAASWAASVAVFLDNGTTAPGSTNTSTPFTNGARQSVWDIAAAAQPGLTSIGAAVMQVRMVTFNVNGDSFDENDSIWFRRINLAGSVAPRINSVPSALM